MYVYFYRALDQPDRVFEEIDSKVNLNKLVKTLHREFAAVFGPEECSYNIHVVFSHLLVQRRKFGPLHLFSTLKYEALYGVIGALYRSGTVAVGKQCLANYILRDKTKGGHLCQHERKLRLVNIY